MKTAIYIAEGVTQLVLTPEREWEQKVLDSVARTPSDCSIMSGSFYETNGGWIREGSDDKSLIIRVGIKPVEA